MIYLDRGLYVLPVHIASCANIQTLERMEGGDEGYFSIGMSTSPAPKFSRKTFCPHAT